MTLLPHGLISSDPDQSRKVETMFLKTCDDERSKSLTTDDFTVIQTARLIL